MYNRLSGVDRTVCHSEVCMGRSECLKLGKAVVGADR
jgi:hypothetical protein